MNKKRGPWHLNYRIKRRIILGISLAILAILYLFRGLSPLILTFSAIALLIVFYLTDHLFDIRFRPHHYFFIIFIAIFSFLLSNLYFIYPSYDKILHFVQPMMLSSIVFFMMDDLGLKLKWRLTFTFFIVIGGIGLFEIAEYGLDSFFDLKLQGVFRQVQEFGEFIIIQSEIDDTMIDMMLGVGGALVYALSTALFFRKRVP